MKDFAAIDFETANFSRTSICSVGIVKYVNGEKVDEYYSLVKPTPEYYNEVCSGVNGMCYEDTVNAPKFDELWDEIREFIGDLPLVAHNKAFDENCLRQTLEHYGLEYPGNPFYCTLIRSREVWPQGHHNLDVIAGYCGYDLKNHHHALADADACAAIALEIL